LRSALDADVDIEDFGNNSSGYGEGHLYLGTTSISTDGSGFGEFQVVLSGNFSNQVFTATATDSTSGETSEFSLAGSPRVTELRRSGANVEVRFITKFGAHYRVEWTDSLAKPISWHTVSG